MVGNLLVENREKEVGGVDLGNPRREPTDTQLAGQEDPKTCCHSVAYPLLTIHPYQLISLPSRGVELPCGDPESQVVCS